MGSQEVTTIGGPLKGQWKWHGGVLAGDGCIYGIPCNAESALKIDPSTGQVTTIGGPFAGAQKWYGGLLGHDGAIYGIPYNASAVLKIVPSTGEVSTIGELPPGGWKWHGGVVAADGTIVGIPSHADSVLIVVPRTGEVRTIGGPLPLGQFAKKGYKYGAVYAIPCDAEHVLKITPVPAEESCSKVSSGTAVTSVLGGPWLGKDKWEGGVQTPDGAIYCMPQQA